MLPSLIPLLQAAEPHINEILTAAAMFFVLLSGAFAAVPAVHHRYGREG